MNSKEPVIYRVDPESKIEAAFDVDPIITEIIRNSLNSVAKQMKQSLVRTAFSPIIYDVLDFAAAIYDRHIRLLAQADSLPAFMGTLNFCVEEAVKGVGGEEALEPGDVILYNWPYGTGSHAQDAAIVMPAFIDDKVIGYAAIKAHWLDIGAQAPSCVGTTDVYQEGTFFPGVKLYHRGILVEDIHRIIIANSRYPKAVSGDINAQVVAAHTGTNGLQRIVARYGIDVFAACCEKMFDHGENIVRGYFRKIPNGCYIGRGSMDNDSLSDDSIDYEIMVEVGDCHVRVDFSETPDAHKGPANCPLPSTVSSSRVAILMLAGGGEAPNDGHFRPVEVKTRPGSMFHPLPPSPCYHFGAPCGQIIEAIFNAFSKAQPDMVPARSADDICAISWWGYRKNTGEFWSHASPHPIGSGASANGDGHTFMHAAEAATRFTPAEVVEAKVPILVNKMELARDSCGAGQYRSGMGVDFFFEVLESSCMTVSFATSKAKPWVLKRGEPGRTNNAIVRRKDGRQEKHINVEGLKLFKGDVLQLHTGGGGGYGKPGDRDHEAVKHDLCEGYISDAFVRKYYQHVFDE